MNVTGLPRPYREALAAHVHGYALVLPVRPRFAFEGEKHVYPKDLMLSVFGNEVGFEPWRWDE